MAASGITVNRNNFAAYGEAVNQKIVAAVKETARDIVAHAKELAPVDTGALRESIYAATDTESLYPEAVASASARRPEAEILPPMVPLGPYEAAVGIAVGYWQMVEFGTTRQAAQPFLTPAVDAERATFEARMREAITP